MNIIYKKFMDYPLRKKLFLCLVLFIILPLLIIAIFINTNTSRIINVKTRDTALQVLKQTSININNLITDTEYISLAALSDDSVQEMVKLYNQESYKEMEQTKINVNGFIQSLLNPVSYVHSICFSKEENIIFQYGDRVSAENTQYNSIAYKYMGKPFWTPTYKITNRVQDDSYKYVISLIRVVNDLSKYNYPLALERISIEEKTICSYYEGNNTYKNGSIFIVDSEGLIISSTDKNMLDKSLYNESFVKSILDSYEKDGILDSKIQNERFSVLFNKLEGNEWCMIQTIPEDEINKQNVLVNIYITASIIFCIIFGLIFSFIQERSIINPLKQLAGEMAKVRKGNFDIKVDIRSNDEIGSMGLLFSHMVEELKNLIDKVYKIQIKEKEAELLALQSQINPHFLYNTLDSIHWLAYRNMDYEVSEQIETLSELFKHVLNMGKEMTTIEEEIIHLKNYLTIQKSRFGEKIEFKINVDDELLHHPSLKLILQPLVENAINHGLGGITGNGEILVIVERKDNMIKYMVADNGIGADKERIEKMLLNDEESHHVFALKNINDRIKLKYGDNFGIKIYSEKNKGTVVEVYFPIDKNYIQGIKNEYSDS